MTDAADPGLHEDAERHRFEMQVEGHTAFIDYRPTPGGLIFVHTLVPKAVEGRGVGGRLVRAALLAVRARGGKVRPDCPFVRGYIDRHPEFADLLAEG